MATRDKVLVVHERHDYVATVPAFRDAEEGVVLATTPDRADTSRQGGPMHDRTCLQVLQHYSTTSEPALDMARYDARNHSFAPTYRS